MKCEICKDRKGRGKRNICRKCWRREYTEKNREKLKKQAQARYLRNRKRRLKQSKDWVKDNVERVRKKKKEDYYKNQELMIIRQQTRHKFNYLKKTEKCKDCGTRENLEFHHSKPYSYDNFEILCTTCHMKREGRLIKDIIVVRNAGRKRCLEDKQGEQQ